MDKKIEILKQYAESDVNKRLLLFLEFPDLRKAFQDIERKDLSQTGFKSFCEKHNKGKYSLDLSLFRRAYRRIIGRKSVPCDHQTLKEALE